MAAATPVTLAASAARTTSGAGSPVDVTDAGATLRLTLDVSATPGSSDNQPRSSLEVFVETSFDGATGWRELRAIPNEDHGASRFLPGHKTRNERLVFPGADRFVRARWVLSGTAPSATFSVEGEAI